MNRFPFVGAQTLDAELSQRNEAIALAERANAAIAKRSEADLPADERRGVYIAQPAPASPRVRAIAALIDRHAYAVANVALLAIGGSACVLAHLCAGSVFAPAVGALLALAGCSIGTMAVLRLFR